MQNLDHILETEFARGMNNKVKPEYVKKGQVVKALNCLVGDQKIKKSPGTSLTFNIGTDTKPLGGISTNAEQYIAINEADNTHCIIYRYTGSGSPTAVSGAILTKDLPVEFVDTGDAVYAFNGTDTVGKLVGATWSTVAGIPKGKWGIWVNNRLYVMGVTATPDNLYYSGANTPETFGGSDYIAIFPDQRSRTTGMNVISGNLVIGKTDNLVTFNGFTEDSFTAKNLNNNLPNFGSRSHRAMVNIGDDLIFLSFSGGVPHFRSLMLTANGVLNDGGVVSTDIEDTMKTLNVAKLDIVCGGFDGRYAYWSVPTGSSIVNDLTLMYDTFEKGWTIHDSMSASFYFISGIVGNSDSIYFGSASANGKVLAIDHSIYSRDSADISMEVISRVYRQQSMRKSKNKYLYVVTGEDTAGDVMVETSPDGYTFEEQGVVSADVGTAVFPFTFDFNFGVTTNNRKRINLKTNPSYTYQIRFTESSSDPVSINEWDLYYYNRKLRDA
jgi:hypothetical protein